ncbi:MAG: hypothetical protein IKC22_01880 [Bacilli bacterium]|nr:hypothetical protein [Bacilli bacterium]
MEDLKFTSIEEALELQEELLKKIDECNKMIFENDESTSSEEFNQEYLSIQNKLEEIDKYLQKNHYHEKVENDNLINRAAFWIWPYMFILIVLSFYPLFQAIDVNIMIKFIYMEQVASMGTTSQIIVIVCAFLILPAALLLLNVIPNFFFKKAETKKVYFYLSLVFWASLLISSVITCIRYVILPFVQ